MAFENANDENVTLTGFTIRNGNAYIGGGIQIVGGNSIISNCKVIQNHAEDDGGGIFLHEIFSLLISNCEITGNTSSCGAGIALGDCIEEAVSLNYCVIAFNSASSYGGGIHLRNASINPNYCLIAYNSSEGGGAGICCEEAVYFFAINCTIANNTSIGQRGGGIYIDSDANITTLNTILWDNTPEQVNCNRDDFTARFEYSDIEGGLEGIVNDGDGEIVWGNGNIDENPLFVDPDEGDFNLTEDSPCINTGDPVSPRDPDGTRADMGAFNFNQGNALYENEMTPSEFGISNIYPNPFNSVVTINYNLPTSSDVSLQLFNITGREVVMVFSEWQTAGSHTVVIDNSGLSAGLYLIRLTSKSDVVVKKVLLVK